MSSIFSASNNNIGSKEFHTLESKTDRVHIYADDNAHPAKPLILIVSFLPCKQADSTFLA